MKALKTWIHFNLEIYCAHQTCILTHISATGVHILEQARLVDGARRILSAVKKRSFKVTLAYAWMRIRLKYISPTCFA